MPETCQDVPYGSGNRYEMELVFMLTMIFPLLLGIFPVEQREGRPSPAEVDRAHQLLSGTWEILSLVDDGDVIGRELVRAKLAENGQITVAEKSFTVINPETGERKTTSFRVDPSQQPRRLDFISRDDRFIRGIYRFDNDELIVCLQEDEDAPTPTDFDAPPGSNRRLIRFRAVPKAAPAPTRVPIPATSKVTLVANNEARRPSDTELKQAREMFEGDWDIQSIENDGDLFGPQLVRQNFAENGRVRFGTRALAINNPKTNQRTITAYRLDPSKTPSEIDVTTQFDTILKGIYAFEGEKLVVCLAKTEDGARPTEFKAPGGSDRFLFQLQLAKSEAPTEAPVPPSPTRAEQAAAREDLIREKLNGSWTINDTKGTLTVVLHSNGTFASTRNWSKSARKLFGPRSDSSRGSWSYANGTLTAWVTSTTDAALRNHQITNRVQSIGDESLVVGDVYGTIRTFQRLR